MANPTKVHAINVNLIFPKGLDTKEHAAVLKTLHDAAVKLRAIGISQFQSDVEGQEGTGEMTTVPCQAVYDGTSPSPLTGDQWMYVYPSGG